MRITPLRIYAATKKNSFFIQWKRILENVMFPNVSMFSQNTTNTTGSFQEANVFHMFHLFFIFYKSCCLCHYFLDLCPPTAKEKGSLCGSFQFYHELVVPKKSQDDDDKAFNSYDFCLYGLRCAVEQDVEKAQCMKLDVEGYLRAALFHCIFYIILSDYADDDRIEVPGIVKITKI